MAFKFRSEAVPLTAEQSELRKRVLNQAENEPATFDMSDWQRVKYYGAVAGKLGQCTTTRCIAGWAQYFARGAVYVDGYADIPTVDDDAVELMGLTEREYYDGMTEQEYNDSQAGEDWELFLADDEDALARLRVIAAAV